MAVHVQGIGVVNFEVYLKGSSRMLGIANLELPTIEMENIEMKGVGLMGTVAMPVRGNLSSLEVKLTWRRMETYAAELTKHQAIQLSLYSDQEGYDAATGTFEDPQHHVELVGIPKTLNLGKWEPSSTVDAETTLEVVTMTYLIKNKTWIEFDKLNYIFKINGADQTAAYRRAVGLS